MSGQRYYGNVVWTNHALQRLTERGFTQAMALQAFQSPDTYKSGKQADSKECVKQFGRSRVTVIAKQNEKSEWVILSCWIDPPLEGTKDYYKKQRYQRYQKLGFWGKLWEDIKSSLFG